MGSLQSNTGVAGAVAREIERIASDPAIQEGAAYKAAFERMGANSLRLSIAVVRDWQAAVRVAYYGIDGARLLAEQEAIERRAVPR
jgi:hypothetical protein